MTATKVALIDGVQISAIALAQPPCDGLSADAADRNKFAETLTGMVYDVVAHEGLPIRLLWEVARPVFQGTGFAAHL